MAIPLPADHLDDAHPYVGSVTLNGKPLDRVYIRHEEIEAGGELHFTMQGKPNKAICRVLNFNQPGCCTECAERNNRRFNVLPRQNSTLG